MRDRSCADVRRLLSDTLSGDGSNDERAAIDLHLDSCADCRVHAGEMFRQDRALAERAAELHLEQTVAAIHARIRPASRRWLPWTAAAAAILAALAALFLRSTPDDNSGPTHVATSIPEKKVVHDVPPPPPEPRRPDEVEVDPPREVVQEPKRPPVPPPPPRPEPKPEPERIPEIEKPKPEPPKPDPFVKPAVVRAVKPARTVKVAVRDGLAYLKSKLPRLTAGSRELVLWTFLNAGVPDGDPNSRRLLDEMLDGKLERTYPVALQAMILEELDRVKYQKRIAQCAQFLVDNQCANGQWSYGKPSLFADELVVKDPPARSGGLRRFGKSKERDPSVKPRVVRRISILKRRQGRPSGDNSSTMFAALGIRACHDAGIGFEPDVLNKAEAWWRKAQILDAGPSAGGWCYGGPKHRHPAYGSMTAGGVASLAIYDTIRRREWRRDPSVVAGMRWLEANFSVEANPGTPEHDKGNPRYAYAYWMYSMERVARFFGREKLGGQDWYEKGSEAFLASQGRDGAWSGRRKIPDTCFAVLFLRRATRDLVDLRR